MAIAWRHINILGEYDFTNGINNGVILFDPAKILALWVDVYKCTYPHEYHEDMHFPIAD